MDVASGSHGLAHSDRLPSWQEKLPHRTLGRASVTHKAMFSVRLTPVTGHCSRHPQCVTFIFFSFLIFVVIFFFPIILARDCVGGKASCLSWTPSASQRWEMLNLHPKSCKVCTQDVTMCGWKCSGSGLANSEGGGLILCFRPWKMPA